MPSWTVEFEEQIHAVLGLKHDVVMCVRES